MRLFHFINASRNPEEFPDFNERHPDESEDRHRRDALRHDLETVGVEESPNEEKNRRHHDPAVRDGRDRKDRKPKLVALRQERILLRLHAEEPFRRLLRHDLRRLLTKVRNLEDIRKNVVSVVAQQRVNVEDDRAHRREEHDVQTDVMKHVLFREPPYPRADRRQRAFHKVARDSDARAFPFARQHPRVGDVAIQARRQHENHHAEFMTFAPQNLARQPVPELVQNFREEERYAQEQQVARSEELLELRQLRAEMIELDPHEQQRGEHQKETAPENDRVEHPANPREQFVEEPVRVDAFESDREDIGARAENLLPPPLLATFQKLVPLVGNAGDDQVALVQLSDKALDFFKRDLLRRKLRFKLLFDRFERFRSVEILENEIFFVLKTKILHPYRIFHNPVGTTKIVRPLGRKIPARSRFENTLRARNQTVR